jgi:hypothetical protein
MAEVYPSDNSLLNLTSDSETGVEYIETGKAPYYLEFRRLLHRLLLATRRANDLRVFDEGGLDIGVKAGQFWNGSTLFDYPGSSGNTLADDKAAIYIYLNSAGTLVIDEYSGFPAVTTNHIRLAVVTTSDGDITAITDYRGQHAFQSFARPGKPGFIPISLAILREVVSNDIPNAAAQGGQLAKDTTPILEYINGDTDSCLRLSWAAGNQDAIVMHAPLPPDFDVASDLELHFRVASGGTADKAGFDLDTYFNEGDMKVEDGCEQVTAATTYEELITTIAAADIPSGAQAVTIELTPKAHGADAMYCTAIWLEYTKA